MGYFNLWILIIACDLMKNNATTSWQTKNDYIKVSGIRSVNVLWLTAALLIVLALVYFDYSRVTNDFHILKRLLTEVRLESAEKHKKITVHFDRDLVRAVENRENRLISSILLSTIKTVNYDTRKGKNMIIFSGGITSPHNIRVHGGDIRLVSWFGFKKNIHVNCAGLAREGTYPEDK